MTSIYLHTFLYTTIFSYQYTHTQNKFHCLFRIFALNFVNCISVIIMCAQSTHTKSLYYLTAILFTNYLYLNSCCCCFCVIEKQFVYNDICLKVPCYMMFFFFDKQYILEGILMRIVRPLI